MNRFNIRDYLLEKFYLALAAESGIGRKYEGERKPSVTMLVNPCLRQAYYRLTIPWPSLNPKGAIRTWVGRRCHETSILGTETELRLEWKEIVGRVDEYDPVKKLLLEKKTTRVTVRGPWPHHVKQLEYYKILLEENGRSVDDGVICYININDGTVQNFSVKFRNSDIVKAEMLEKKKTLQDCLSSGILPPRKIRTWDPGGVNLICDYCDFFGLCVSEDGLDSRWKSRSI